MAEAAVAPGASRKSTLALTTTLPASRHQGSKPSSRATRVTKCDIASLRISQEARVTKCDITSPFESHRRRA
eukprot:759353-Prorocentrum_minimum.AAC.2